MIVYHSLTEYAADGRKMALTIGKFDGLHTGHMLLIEKVKEYAGRHHTGTCMLAIDSKPPHLLTKEERRRAAERAGIDCLIECPFSKKFMTLTPDLFARRVLKEILCTRYIAVGDDFRFGYNRQGDADWLLENGAAYGFTAEKVKKKVIGGEAVSSTRIRSVLSEGRMEEVKLLLGRPFPVSGTIIHGAHLGSTQLNYPTINMAIDQDKLTPPYGVYASYTRLRDGRLIPGVTNVGVKPTVGGRVPLAETNLFGIDEDLYGQEAETYLEHFIRPEIKFSSVDELKSQISLDTRKAANLLDA